MGTSSTKYLRKRTRIEISRSEDYESPLTDNEYTDEYIVTRYKILEVLATPSNLDIDLGEFGQIYDVVIHNRDESNYVETRHQTINQATYIYVRVDPGKTVSLGPIDAASDLRLFANGGVGATTVSCECIVEVYGAAA